MNYREFDGLDVGAVGNITLTQVTANHNSGYGTQLGLGGSGRISVSSSEFNHNGLADTEYDGLYL